MSNTIKCNVKDKVVHKPTGKKCEVEAVSKGGISVKEFCGVIPAKEFEKPEKPGS